MKTMVLQQLTFLNLIATNRCGKETIAFVGTYSLVSFEMIPKANIWVKIDLIYLNNVKISQHPIV